MPMRMNKGIIMILLLTVSLFITPGIGLASSGTGLSIGVAWMGEAGMPLRICDGMMQSLEYLAPGIEVELQKALASLEKMDEVVARFQDEKDAMVILRSNGTVYLAENPPRIPTFIGATADPSVLGAIQNLASPEGNITGVTYDLPAEIQWEVFTALLPDMESVLLLGEEGHPSFYIEQAQTREICQELGIEYREEVLSDPDDVLAAVTRHAGSVSAFVIGNQALNIDIAEDIVIAAGDTPVLSYSNRPVLAGALGGFVADDEKLGYMLGESIVDVLVNGKTIADVGVKTDPEPTFYVNVTTAERLEIQIPFGVLSSATIIE